MWQEGSRLLLPDLRQTAVARSTLSCATLLADNTVKTVAADGLLGEAITANALNHRLWVLRTSAHWQSICAALIRLSDYLDVHHLGEPHQPCRKAASLLSCMAARQ
jgi:hypothetical protein